MTISAKHPARAAGRTPAGSGVSMVAILLIAILLAACSSTDRDRAAPSGAVEAPAPGSTGSRLVGGLQTYESRKVSSGDVVALDRNQTDCVVPANRDNAALVVGVAVEVYECKGVWFSKVAQHGRASCKVIGDVAPGNLLVASAEPGFAENGGWYLQPGTIIGKALSSTAFDEGMRTGTVDVLVTLS